ncbi:glycosyl transferase family 90 [Vibrio sp. CAU 1672]|uniref:glycosyl transferase family 90 n=1 Tax=Vibrio sp. CAU 1672 TaxID=3032594 RepID=UPI0023DA73C6|nr:glycosyl transferase family 90 [Vibrio sp. CAU 1672]MDF2153940.1 glycosyl transferase family 90 [Vibrio sp. CAU 1672]
MKKIKYYLKNVLLASLPSSWFRCYGKNLMSNTHEYDETYLQQRVNYYNQLDSGFSLTQQELTRIQDFKKTGGSAYYYDLLKVIKCFPKSHAFKYINGDVIDVPSEPSFLKSRPIAGNNTNSVLLKLNAVRHYYFIDSDKPYRDKKDMLVWRGTGFRPNRRTLLSAHFHNPRCNVGRVDTQDKDPEQLSYVTPPMSIKEQLDYKFILSLEGMDVATNLKWIMSSNSLCFTPKLRYETWFMEGKLQAGVHFVEVRDDFSDLDEKMDYYLAHPEEAEAIIQNAHEWVEQFKHPKRERLISLLVAEKYFANAKTHKVT